MEVPKEQVSLYGVATIEGSVEDDVVRVTDLVEKPPVDEAPSNWAIIGRYVIDPAVFEVLENTPPGRGGEIQLTDALRTLAGRSSAEGGQVHGVLFRGRRYDTGDKLDYLRTVVKFAADRPDLAPEFLPWLREFLDEIS
jgi:UTP--glucose-1-phosphate uridylyltransferase